MCGRTGPKSKIYARPYLPSQASYKGRLRRKQINPELFSTNSYLLNFMLAIITDLFDLRNHFMTFHVPFTIFSCILV